MVQMLIKIVGLQILNLISTVKKTKADLGIALDGDADRCVLVDDKGELLMVI